MVWDQTKRHFGQCYACNFVGTQGKALLFQRDYASVHKVTSMKTWLDKFGVKELAGPDFNPMKHYELELEWRLRARSSHPTCA